MADWFNSEGKRRYWLLADGLTVAFDSTIREQHRSTSTLTDAPIETGSVFSDHIITQPKELAVDVAVSDIWAQQGDAAVDMFDSRAGRAARCWELLEDIKDAKTPFSVQTGFKLYKSMCIVGLDADQDKMSATVAFVRVTLREAIQTSTQTVTYPPRKAGKPKRTAAKPTSVGEKKSEQPGKTPEQRRSLAKQAYMQYLGADSGVDFNALAAAVP
jgi:hypothetical protein